MLDSYLWQEDPALKNLFEAEISVIKSGLGGDFELLKLFNPKEKNSRVIALGVLKYDSDSEQMILIEFPTKYPNSPPKIKAIEKPSKSKFGDFHEPFQIHLFGTKQQYNDGTLCLIRKDLWLNSNHGIGWVLRRAQYWLKSFHSKNGFKKDQVVEEYPAHFPHNGQVLLPKNLNLPKSGKSGEILLNQFKPNYFLLVENLLTNSPFTNEINQEKFRWFKFNIGDTIKDTLKSNDANLIINLIKNTFGEGLRFENQQCNIALYFPSEPIKWHFFKLILINAGTTVQVKSIYYLTRIIDEELYLRTSTIFNDKILLKNRVTIVGLGAIGSEVARSLSRNAVGHFNLFDNDTFEIGNSVRHAADLYYIGDKKVDVAKSLIQRSNPNITVNSFHIDILDDVGLLEESLKNSDLCIVLTGEDSVDYLLNDKYSSKFSIPFVFARVSAGGVSGSIQIVNENSACLRCLSNKGLDYLPDPKVKTDYSELKPEYGSCSSPALPGSEIDTKEIALQVSRISLQLLLEKENPTYAKLEGYQYYWHGPFGTDNQKPFTWEILNHAKDSNCKVCGK